MICCDLVGFIKLHGWVCYAQCVYNTIYVTIIGCRYATLYGCVATLHRLAMFLLLIVHVDLGCGLYWCKEGDVVMQCDGLGRGLCRQGGEGVEQVFRYLRVAWTQNNFMSR